MPISSIILKVPKESLESILKHLESTPKVLVHETTADQIIVTTDTHSIEEDKKLVKNLINFSGVLSGNVVFTNIEDCI